MIGAGGVTVPPALVGPLLRVLVRALAREVREDGGVIPPGIAVFLRDLQTAVDPGSQQVADDGQADDEPDTIGVAGYATVAQVATYTGHAPRTLRRWAAAGHIRAHRAGRTWLIDPDSLKGSPAEGNTR